MGSEVSTSAAIPGHKGHKERLPAAEDQFRVVPVEVHLYTEDNMDQGLDTRSTFLPRTLEYQTFPPNPGWALTWTVPSLNSMRRA